MSLSRLLYSARHPASLRKRLILLVVATAAPLLIFALIMVIRLSREERATFERGATERARALLTAVDAELGSSITALEALATWYHLDSNDLWSFHEDATRVLRSQPSWITITLADPSGRQLVNLNKPYGTALPRLGESRSFARVLQNARPAVGQLSSSPFPDQQAFTVRVPVIRDGVVKYVLTAIVDPNSINALLTAQRLPETWIGVVLDADRRFIARTLDSEHSIGRLASASLRAALDRAPEGWFQGNTIEGLAVYTPYSRSAVSGWTVAIGIPAASVEANLRHSLFYVGSIGLALLALGIAIAWLLSSRTAKSIGALAVMAENLGFNEKPGAKIPPAPPHIPSGVAEIEVVRDTLISADRLIREHSDQRDRVEAQLRAVSERLELAQEAGNIGSFERDLVTGGIQWSASQEKLYGLELGSFGGSREDWYRRLHPEDLAAVEEAVRISAETHVPLLIEYRIVRPDGSVRWIASQGRVFADDTGKPRRLMGVNIDITARKMAEEALRESDRRKDEFLAMLGHELRNPLGVINTCVQLLMRKGPPDPTLTEIEQMIARQVEHMARMLEDLLDVSRITRGQIRLKKELCDFAEIVRNAVSDHRGNFAESGLELAAELPDSPLWLMGDRTRLAQVVGNLLFNANKFTDRGGRVTVTLSRIAGARALLSVKDTGIGIEPEILRQIFAPFIQSDHSIDRSRGGLGLGLALVKGLVELHGGKARAHSDGLGCGAEFILELPLETPAASAAGQTTAVEQRAAVPRRIVLIEDNPMAARSLQMYLHGAGHDVEVAHTGPDGIAAAQRFRPQVVLCDIGLPGFDGYAVARSLRRERGLEHLYMVAISGYGRDGDQRRACEAGFDLHLSKPVDLEKIDAILADLPRAGKET
jgi:PAS domain S-box-containing protein